jgi:integrase
LATDTEKDFVTLAQYNALIDAIPKVAEPEDVLWLRTLLEFGRCFGWRRNEMLDLRVGQADLSTGMLALDSSQTKTTKSRRARMSPVLLELVRQCCENKAASDYILTREGKRIRDFRGAWRRITSASGVGYLVCRSCYAKLLAESGRALDFVALLELASQARIVEDHCVKCGDRMRRHSRKFVGLLVHDLRRTAVRDLIRAGVPQSIAMKITGHRTTAVFDRYDIGNDTDLAIAARQLETYQAAEQAKLAPQPESNCTTTALGEQQAVAASPGATVVVQ